MEKFKIKFNLSIKIILSVIFLLATTTLINIVYSYSTFTKDKVSYLHELLLRKTESSQKLVDNYFERIKLNSKSNYLILVGGSGNSKEIFESNNDLIMFEKFQISGTDFKKNETFFNRDKLVSLKLKYGLNQDWLSEEIKKYLSSDLVKKENPVRLVKYKGQNLALLTIYRDNQRNEVMISLYSFIEIERVLNPEKIFSKELFFLQNNSIAQNSNSFWFKDIDYKKVKFGTFEVEIDKIPYLMSYSTSDQNHLILVTYLNKKEALSISDFLILKTILFSFVLLGIAIAMGIYFASAISSPLKELALKANDIKQGKFNQKIYFNSQDELGVLASAFNNMSSEIQMLLGAKESMIKKLEIANRKLDKYSHKLEVLVDERTKELKKANDSVQLMINSLDEGLFVFDRELICNDIATNACLKIFHTEVAGNSLLSILKIPEENIETLQKWSKILFDELIPFESAIELGPKTMQMNEKHISINYYPIRDADGAILNVVGVAKDDTGEVIAKDLKIRQEKYVNMILKISRNKNQFLSFCSEVDNIFLNIENELSNVENIKLDICMMHFHTLNGGFGMYFLNDLQKQARDIEQQILDYKNSNQNVLVFIDILKNETSHLQKEFNMFILKLDQEIKTNFATGIKKLEIEKKDLEKFLIELEQANYLEFANEFKNSFILEPIGQYFFTFKEFCQNLAFTLGKKLHEVEIKNGDIKVNVDDIIDIINVLPHLFRNAVDHGIEQPHVRLANNKDESGTIKIIFQQLIEKDLKYLIINIQDDGGGIDPILVKEKYQSIFPEKNLSKYTEKDLQMLIFDPFFSTKDQSTSISGRGVGMSAVAQVIQEKGGTINLMSRVGIGTKFEIKIPLFN